jgi:hypothetical protein
MVSEVAHWWHDWEFLDDAQFFPYAFLIDLLRYTLARLSKDDNYRAKASDFFVSLSEEEKATGGRWL